MTGFFRNFSVTEVSFTTGTQATRLPRRHDVRVSDIAQFVPVFRSPKDGDLAREGACAPVVEVSFTTGTQATRLPRRHDVRVSDITQFVPVFRSPKDGDLAREGACAPVKRGGILHARACALQSKR